MSLLDNTAPTEEQRWHNVKLRASVSNDGGRVTVVFPHDFIGANVAFQIDHYGRHRIIFDPVYNGQNVVGFVGGDGVKYGKVEFNPAALGITDLMPGASNQWSARERDTDILIGNLITDMRRPQEKQTVKEVEVVKEVVVEKPMTIEGAINFINEWAAKNRADLGVEDNVLFAEVRQRIGSPPPPPLRKVNPWINSTTTMN